MAVHGRMVARLVRPSVQPVRAPADLPARRGVERPLPARHRALREAEMAAADRAGDRAGEAVLPPASFPAAHREAPQGSGRRPALRAPRDAAPPPGHHAPLRRDTVRALLAEHDVWITDWVNARLVPLSQGPFHLADYVDYVREWITMLSPRLHVVSVCQPTVPVLAAVSLMAAKRQAQPLTMTMMGGPIDAPRSPPAVNNLARRKPYSWFERQVIERVPPKYPGYMRRVYPGFLQHLGFVAMNPDRHVSAHWEYYNHLMLGDGESAEAHRRFYDEYNAVLDLPAEHYLDTANTVFQDFALPKGRMFVREELVRPHAIHQPALLTLEGELDDISGNGQTEAAHALCLNIPRARRAHFVAPGVGHYGIFSGRRWREVVFPHVRDFIAANSATAAKRNSGTGT